MVLSGLSLQFEIIIIDDGSNDSSYEIALQLADIYKGKVAVKCHLKNYGYGLALRSGFDMALFDLCLLCDADGQFDVSEIKKLLPYIKDYDIVLGYRLVRNDPFYRRLLGGIWKLTIRQLLEVNFKDVNCGLKLFKSEAIRSLHLYSHGGTISAEILTKARQAKMRIKEVAVNHKPRINGKSTGANIKTIARMCYELMVITNENRINQAA